MTYLCKFDEKGQRTETLLGCEYNDEQKAEMFENGYIEISEEDWNYYVGNEGQGDNGTGYVRDAVTGKPVSAPPRIITKEEKIAQLDSEYRMNQEQLKDYYIQAQMNLDTEIMNELQQEMQQLREDYDKELAQIENE